jgi:hypothetical protein
MLPMTVAESNRHRASGRENGTTAATWEIVNGIKYLRCHRAVIVQPYKLQALHKIKIENDAMANVDIANHVPRSSPASWSWRESYMLDTNWRMTYQ